MFVLSKRIAWKRSSGGGTEYNWGAGMSEAADYPCEASACEGKKLGGGGRGLKPP